MVMSPKIRSNVFRRTVWRDFVKFTFKLTFELIDSNRKWKRRNKKSGTKSKITTFTRNWINVQCLDMNIDVINARTYHRCS